ncbi:hypothetical protein [Piscinibacter sp. XHJ-5]|uniref:hypothetical protein n=1 Tax=Piscinibacter sp. XHJ-5 TaxID=3037797 RepID=UPI0024535AE0|nr:hypothetical protein [Piscinibacter sp. XHJ-5]
MKLLKYMLAIAAGALTTHFVLKYRGLSPAGEGLGSFGPDPMDDDEEATATRGEASEFANPAERLQEEGMIGSAAGPELSTQDLFSSSSQRGEEPVTPGLPDLTRGA